MTVGGDSSIVYFGLSHPDESPSVARRTHPAAFLEVWNPHGLHLCEMPHGYVAPRSFVKLFYHAVVWSKSQSSAIRFFLHLLRDTRVVCGRCRTTIHCKLWNRGAARRLYAVARRAGNDWQLEDRMLGDYSRLQPTCPACGLTTHLAHIELPLFEDHAIALLPPT